MGNENTKSLVHAPFEDLVRKLARKALDVDPKFQNLFSSILKLRREELRDLAAIKTNDPLLLRYLPSF